MPWRLSSVVEQRLEFVRLAQTDGVSFAELCRRFGVKRDTGYKWVQRFAAEGVDGLVDRSRRPGRSPNRTPVVMEELVCSVRGVHPAWGGRKIRGFLLRQGHSGVPAASTITQILRRYGLVVPAEPPKRDFQRWERSVPNELWQMDFKGWFRLSDGQQCHPFGVIDDHSRYSISLRACLDQQTSTVQGHLETAFGRYGLPEAMLMDNGSPWGNTWDQPWTPLTVWLCDLGTRSYIPDHFIPRPPARKNASTTPSTSRCSTLARSGRTRPKSRSLSKNGNRYTTITDPTNHSEKPSSQPTVTSPHPDHSLPLSLNPTTPRTGINAASAKPPNSPSRETNSGSGNRSVAAQSPSPPPPYQTSITSTTATTTSAPSTCPPCPRTRVHHHPGLDT